MMIIKSKISIFYHNDIINFRDMRKIQIVAKNFICIMFLLFLILFIYKHSCIVYLQEMRPMGVFAWTLVSVVVCLESLHGQCSIALALEAIVVPGMHEYLVIFTPLSKI